MLDIISLTRIKTKLSSIRWRLSIAYLLIIGVAFSVVGVSLFQLVGEYLFNQRIKEDQRFAESLAEQLREPLDRMDAAALLRLSQEACADGGGRVLVLDAYGVVQSDTESALNGTRFENLEAARVLSGGASEYGFYEDGQRSARWSNAIWSLFSGVKSMSGVYAAPISGDEGLAGALVYVSQVQEIYQNLHEMQLKILTWLLVVAAAVILMNVFALRTITRPVSELREGIAKMSGGDFSAHVSVRGRNEFAELAEAFNSMSDRLGQLDKSRNQFVSNASHELKTPLSTMKILIETILYQDPLDPGMTKEFLNDVNGGMKLNAAELDIRDLLLEQVKRLAPLARENGIELDCAAREAVEVFGDSLKLQQVLYNVIDNAIKYTPRGGEVHAELTRSGKRAIIRISDSGIGIPAADLPHIFDRFYRVDKARSRATGGTGLGLSIVKQIVQLHGGTITATSEENAGSTFTIDLPIAPKKDAKAG